MSHPIAPGKTSPSLYSDWLKEAKEFEKNRPNRDAATPDRRVHRIDRSQADPQVVQAAEGLEQMFVDYLMQTMRKSVPQNEFMPDSTATNIYRSMLDSEYAEKAVRAGGIGLADQIIAYLEMQRYNLKEGQDVPLSSPGTGGTHESQPSAESVDSGERQPLPGSRR